MRRRCFAALIAALLFLCVPAQARRCIVYEVFGAYLDSLRDQAGIPGLAAAIVDTNGIVWERAYGRQDIARALATRTDTPFNADGLTQTITAAMVLRCVEERRLSLDDSVGTFRRRHDRARRDDSPAPDAHVWRPRQPRVRPSSRAARAAVADRARMRGRFVSRDVRESAPPSRDVRLGSRSQHRHDCGARRKACPIPRDVERYAAVLQRRATPYSVDGRGARAAVVVSRVRSALTPSTGLVTTVRDLAKFDLALKQGILLERGTLELRVERAERERRAAAARHRMVRADLQRRESRLAVRHGRERIVVADDHAAGPRADVDSDGEQRRAGEAVFAGERRHHAVAVRAIVLERVRPVMRARWLALALWLLPAPAAAEWQVRPFIGFSFGGATTFVDPDHAIETQNVVIGDFGRLARRDFRSRSGLWPGAGVLSNRRRPRLGRSSIWC